MAGFVKEWIINIIALVLFIILLEIIIPSGKTRKYVNLVTGFLLIIAIINPFVKLLKGGVSLEGFQLAGSAELQKLEIEKSSNLYKKEQMKQIVEVYRQKVIRQLEKSASETEGVASAQADVIINEDETSENFGEVKRAYINIVPKGREEQLKPVDSVNRVRVEIKPGTGAQGKAGDISGGSEAEADNNRIDAGIVKSIEEKVGTMFNLKSDNIIIGLQEK